MIRDKKKELKFNYPPKECIKLWWIKSKEKKGYLKLQEGVIIYKKYDRFNT